MVKSNESGKKKGKRTKKKKELRKKVMQCIDIAFVYLKWVSTIWCIRILLFLIDVDVMCWWYLKQKSIL